jgi:hypothetical protein
MQRPGVSPMAGLVATTSNLMIVHIGDASIVNIPSSFVPVVRYL